jgi:hypothetical protein
MIFSTNQKITYNDIWFKLVGCLAISGIIDSLGRTEPIFSRLSTSYFYTDLLGGFVIAFLIWEYVRVVIKKLDRRYDWLYKPVQRVSLQVLFCILAPALLSFAGTLLFMRLAYDQDIFETSWIYSEFYAVVLIIICINLVYFAWWLILYLRQQPKTATVAAPPADHFIEVKKGDRIILLSPAEIALVNLEGAYSFIKTHDERSFVTSYTLDDLHGQLGDTGFFRANRQVIVSRKTCKSYQSIENGKINIEIGAKNKTDVIVSQKRAKDFRKWIANGIH